MRLLLIITSLFFFLVGCGETYSKQDKNQFDKEIEHYIANQSLPFTRTESGLYYHIVEQQKDTLNRTKNLLLNDEVVFYYQGSLLDGEVFQEIQENEALQFRVKELIYGWQEALQLIYPAGKIKVIIPPYLGYADNETGLVPANSILVFDLVLKEVI